jgi:anti-sigma factor RsiW
VLDAWFDRELDGGTQAEVAVHLGRCPDCAALNEDRKALRALIARAAPRARAPADLLRGIRLAVDRQGEQPKRFPAGPSWLMAASLSGVAACLGAVLTLLAVHLAAFESPADVVVKSHVAALQAADGSFDRLVQVASSDRHGVKPWLRGKVDFAPPVEDLREHGYALLGARLDHVDGKRAAVIVYRIRNHPIDLYVWGSSPVDDEPPALSVHRGFNVATWAESGIRLAAVSDVDRADLDRFASLMYGKR